MPNSEVKRRSADGSVGPPHARVGNCQASKQESPLLTQRAFLRLWIAKIFLYFLRYDRFLLRLLLSVP
jgi:hypothetical protein